jgi:hypothetical protein
MYPGEGAIPQSKLRFHLGLGQKEFQAFMDDYARYYARGRKDRMLTY